MKKFLIVVILFIFGGFTTIKATTYSAYLPGGKNYLEGYNLVLNNNTLSTIDPIRVKPNTNYTFTIPDPQAVHQIELEVFNGDGYYKYFDVEYGTTCYLDLNYTSCTFNTENYEYIEFSMYSPELGSYYMAYGTTYMILEEGDVFTSYEDYIPPTLDQVSPEFNGSGAYVKSYREIITIDEIIQNYIFAYDAIDGDISDRIEIVSDSYTGNMHTVGEYPVDLQVADFSGNIATYQLLVIVKDEHAPIINGPDYITVNVDNDTPLDSIISSNFSASDEYDGTINIVAIYDQYTANIHHLGTYSVQLTATDSSDNMISKEVLITIADQSPPELTSASEYVSNLSNPLTLADITNDFVFSDNYDDPQSITYDVISDTFTGNGSIVGDYIIDISMTDLSGNTAVQSIVVTSHDDIYPSISGPTNITMSYTDSTDIQTMLQQFTVSDNYDSLTIDDVVVDLDEFTGRTSSIGVYQIKCHITDAAGNQTNHTLVVNIVDDQAPIIYVDDYVITVSPAATFSPRDALNMLIQNETLPDGEYDIITVRDEYQGNEAKPGTYDYALRFVDQDGNQIEKDFVIKVAEQEESSLVHSLLVRNIVVYSLVGGFVLFFIIKIKK